MNQQCDREDATTESLTDLALSIQQADKTKGGTSNRSGDDEIIVIAGAGGSCCHVK